MSLKLRTRHKSRLVFQLAKPGQKKFNKAVSKIRRFLLRLERLSVLARYQKLTRADLTGGCFGLSFIKSVTARPMSLFKNDSPAELDSNPYLFAGSIWTLGEPAGDDL